MVDKKDLCEYNYGYDYYSIVKCEGGEGKYYEEVMVYGEKRDRLIELVERMIGKENIGLLNRWRGLD